jgi:hypothetical protein
MEVAGVTIGVVGLAGLFSTCIDIANKVDAFKDASASSRSAAACVRAEKHLLERWGRDVGFKDGKLLPKHHPALDNPTVVARVQEILMSVLDLCKKLDGSLEPPSHNKGEIKPLRRAPTGFRTAPGAPLDDIKLSRLGWAIKGQARAQANLGQLGELVKLLVDLVNVPDSQLERMLADLQGQRDCEFSALLFDGKA